VTGYRVLTSCYANLWLKNTAGKIASCIFSVHISTSFYIYIYVYVYDTLVLVHDFGQTQVCRSGCAAIVDSGTSLIAAPASALMELGHLIGQIEEDRRDGNVRFFHRFFP
jgi:hypothetical protein